MSQVYSNKFKHCLPSFPLVWVVLLDIYSPQYTRFVNILDLTANDGTAALGAIINKSYQHYSGYGTFECAYSGIQKMFHLGGISKN